MLDFAQQNAIFSYKNSPNYFTFYYKSTRPLNQTMVELYIFLLSVNINPKLPAYSDWRYNH